MGIVIGNGVVREGLTKELTFRRKGVPGGGHSKCKGPEVRPCFSEEQQGVYVCVSVGCLKG